MATNGINMTSSDCNYGFYIILIEYYWDYITNVHIYKCK